MEVQDGLRVDSNFPAVAIDTINDLSINDELKDKIKTIIQNISPAFRYGLPLVVQGESLFLSSPPGTQRSTLSIIGLLHLIDKSNGSVQGIYIAPRKSLIDEYLDIFRKYNTNPGVSLLKCIGGEAVNKKLLKKSQVLVCSPGKLVNLLEGNLLDLTSLKIVIFDVCSGLFMNEIKPQSEKILSHLPSSLVYWFLSPIPDEVSMSVFLLKKPEGKTIDILDERVLKQVSFYYKVYDSEEDIFQYVAERCEISDRKIVVFSCDNEELDKAFVGLTRFQPLVLSDRVSLDEQLRVRDEFYNGNAKVILVYGSYHLVRKVICKEKVETYCFDLVNGNMLVARARRGMFQQGDKVVLFCKQYEVENINGLERDLSVVIGLID